MPHEFAHRPRQNVPGKADLQVGIARPVPFAVGLLQRPRERGRGRIEVGHQKREQVFRGRPQRARPREGRQVPVGHDMAVTIVTRREPGAHHGCERDRGLGHGERRENPARYELLVTHLRFERERMARQAHAEVRVFVGRADFARQLVARQERVHLLDAVIGVRVHRVARGKVRRHARQPGRLRRQIEQGDLSPVPRGDVRRARQILRDRIVEPHFAAAHHVGEDRRSEDLRDRTDLEYVIGVNTNRDYASALVQQPDDDSLPVFAGVGKCTDACQQDRVDSGVGWQALLQTQDEREGRDEMHAGI